MKAVNPKDALSLPRRAFCYWVNESTQTVAIVFTDNAFGYYIRSLPHIKNGDFKYQGAAFEFVADSKPDLLFKPLILKLHQDIHDVWVAKGYNVISKRPEQNLTLTMRPAKYGWKQFLGNGTTRYEYKSYSLPLEMREGLKLTVNDVLWAFNRRANDKAI